MSIVASSVTALALIPAAIAGEGAGDSRAAGSDGEAVYAKVCGYCHDTGVGPALLGRNLPAVYIRFTVRNGMRAMPAFRSAEIDDASLEQLVDYVTTSTGDR